MCKIDDSLNHAVETLKSVCAQKATNNEFLIFGQHIAAQLEKLPIQQPLLLQEKIQGLITITYDSHYRDIKYNSSINIKITIIHTIPYSNLYY